MLNNSNNSSRVQAPLSGALSQKLNITGSISTMNFNNYYTKNEVDKLFDELEVSSNGDMRKEVYDTNGDGKVDSADLADKALLADEATVAGRLKTPVNIAGVEFDGSADIELTKANVGLSNVDNTSDLDKPISTATQEALSAIKGNAGAGVTLGTVDTKTQANVGEITTLKGSMTAVEGEVRNIKTKVIGTENRLEAIEPKVTALESKVDVDSVSKAISDAISSIDGSINLPITTSDVVDSSDRTQDEINKSFYKGFCAEFVSNGEDIVIDDVIGDKVFGARLEGNTKVYKSIKGEDDWIEIESSEVRDTDTYEYKLEGTKAIITNNGQKYVFYASEEDKHQGKPVELNKVGNLENLINTLELLEDESSVRSNIGDMTDTLEILEDGSAILVEAINEYIVTGNEFIAIYRTNEEYTSFRVKTNLEDLPIPECWDRATTVNTHFINLKFYDVYVGKHQQESVSIENHAGNKAFVITVKNDKLNNATVEGMKQYLQSEYEKGNPIKIKYLRKTPITTQIPKELIQTIPTQQSNIFSFGEEVKPSKAMVKVSTGKSIDLSKINEIELKANTNTSSINSLRTTTINHNTRLTAVENKATTNTKDITTLKNNVSTVENKVDTLEPKVSALETKVDVDSVSGAISTAIEEAMQSGSSSDTNYIQDKTGRTQEDINRTFYKQSCKEFVSSGEDIVIDNGLDGYLLSGKLEGDTIKCVSSYSKKSDISLMTTPYSIDNEGYISYDFVEGRATYLAINCQPITPKAKYTLIVEVEDISCGALLANNTFANRKKEFITNTNYRITKSGITIIPLEAGENTSEIVFCNHPSYGAVGGSCKFRFTIIEGEYTHAPCKAWLPYGLHSAKATFTNNGVKYSFYANEEGKVQGKVIELDGIKRTNSVFASNSISILEDGTCTYTENIITLDSEKLKTYLGNQFPKYTNGDEIQYRCTIQGYPRAVKETVFGSISTKNNLGISDIVQDKMHRYDSIGDRCSVERNVPNLLIMLTEESLQPKDRLKPTREDFINYFNRNSDLEIKVVVEPETTILDKSIIPLTIPTYETNNFTFGDGVKPSKVTLVIPISDNVKKEYNTTLLNNYTQSANRFAPSVSLMKDNKTVKIQMDLTAPSTGMNVNVFALPTELRPKTNTRIPVFVRGIGQLAIIHANNGYVELSGLPLANANIYINTEYRRDT